MTKSEIKEDNQEVAKEVKVSQSTTSQPVANLWGGKLLWGTLFISTGLLLLLANLDIITVRLENLWQLWPVLIIIAGLSIMSLSGWLGRIVYVLAAVMIAVLAWIAVTGGVGDERVQATGEFSINSRSKEIESLALEVKSGAGSIDIDGTSNQDLVAGSFNSDVAKLSQTVEVDGNKQSVKLALNRLPGWAKSGAKNPLSLKINKQMPLEMIIDAGASNIDADFSEMSLRSLTIDSGASSIDAKLGSKLKESRVLIDTGVSSVKLSVPKDAGVRLKVDSGLSLKDLPDNFTESEKKVYLSDNYGKATNKIDIEIDMGVSSFELRTY